MADQDTIIMRSLGRRAIACRGFRYLAGMRLWCEALGFKRITDEEMAAGVTFAGWLPDPGDPATFGCFLQVVENAWGTRYSVELSTGGGEGMVEVWAHAMKQGAPTIVSYSAPRGTRCLATALTEALEAHERHSSALVDPSSSATSDAGR